MLKNHYLVVNYSMMKWYGDRKRIETGMIEQIKFVSVPDYSCGCCS